MAKTSTPSATTATSTPSAQVSPSDNDINQNLTERIKNITQEKLSSAEAQIKEKINQLSLVGYAGKVTSVTANSLTIDSNSEIFQIATDDTTSVVNAGQKIKLSSVAIGDKIIVIGTINAKRDVIAAKRIVEVKTDTSADKPEVYFGTIQTIDVKKKTIVLKTNTDGQTLILSKKANLKIDDLSTGKNVLVIVRTQDAGKVIMKVKIL